MRVAASKRVHRSANDWRGIFKRQQSSGLGQAAFCQREGIALSTFSRWKQQLSSEPGQDRSDSDSADADWIDLSPLAHAGSGWVIELDLGDGVCLRLRRG